MTVELSPFNDLLILKKRHSTLYLIPLLSSRDLQRSRSDEDASDRNTPYYAHRASTSYLQFREKPKNGNVARSGGFEGILKVRSFVINNMKEITNNHAYF